MDQELRRLISLVQAKNYDEARQPLVAYLKAHPESAHGWYLQSFVAWTAAEKQAAIQRALKLSPDNAKIIQRSSRLNSAPVKSSGSQRWLLFVGIALVAVVAVGIFLLQSRSQPADILPTMVILQVTETTQQASSQSVIQNPTATVILSATPLPPTPTSTAELAIATTTLSPTSVPPTATLVPPTLTDVPTVTSTQVSVQPPTVDSSLILTRQASQPTVPPNQVVSTLIPSPTQPTATPFTPVPSPTLIVSGVVPFGQQGNIGVGQVRIIQAARPGTSAIQQMGGTVPNAPAGQDWVLVELLMQCSTTENCASSLGAPRLQTASGKVYDMPAGITLEPIFGADAYFSGQVWGFAAFLVPSTESNLSLVLNQNSQSYAFALQ